MAITLPRSRACRPLRLAALTALLVALLAPAGASAATCDDYKTQADAQRAADTRDADGDGVYCENLPCPCLRPGDGDGDGGGDGSPPKQEREPRRQAQRISARITSVVDGDTIKVRASGARRRFYTVRLIGIDTPETKRPGVSIECGGPQATQSMLRLAFTDPEDTDDDGVLDTDGGTGRRVTLTTDPTQDTFDRYDRLLAYATTRAGVELGRRQLSAGWATTYVYDDQAFQRVDGYRGAERRRARRPGRARRLRRRLPPRGGLT